MTSFAEHARLALLEGRRLAESLMTDTCKVERPDRSQPRDPITNEHPLVTVYEGRAKSQTYEGYESTRDIGAHLRTEQRYRADFPVGSFRPEVGDVITWLTSQDDPDLVGVKDRITAPFNKSKATAMRVFVDRLSA